MTNGPSHATPAPRFSRMTERLSAPDGDVWKTHYDAEARKAAGEDIVLLSVGDPDFSTPPEIVNNVVKHIVSGRTHYSPAAGEPALREAIAELESQSTGRPFEPQQFVIFPGATAAVHAVLTCILNPGDELLIPEPMYIGYRGIIDAVGAQVNTVSLAPQDFSLDLRALEQAVTARTRAVLVNTPGNPCGNIIPPEQLSELASFTRERGIWLICDEVYSLITFDAPHVSLLKCTDDYSNIAVVDGLSKSHAMTGWRIGWVVADPPLATALTNYSGAAFFGCSQFVQDAAAEALRTDASHVDAMREAYRSRRDLIIERFAPVNDIRVVRPQAGMFVMLDVSAITEDSTAFAEVLLDTAGVSVLPGAAFGETARSMVRIGLTLPEPELDAAATRIIDALPDIRSRLTAPADS